MKKRMLALVMTFVMVFSLLPVSAFAVNWDAELDDELASLLEPDAAVDEGIVSIRKTAERDADIPGKWHITMTVEAQEEIKVLPLEVVLVLDTSGSMQWVVDKDEYARNDPDHSESRMEIAKSAAKGLIDDLASSGLNVSMAIATFNGDVKDKHGNVTQESTGEVTHEMGALTEANKQGFKNDLPGYDDANRNATWMIDGLRFAEGQFTPNSDAQKVIIMLSDGANNGADPVSYTRANLSDVQIYTVGFATTGNQTLKNITKAGADGGQYFDAKDSGSLVDSFKQIAKSLTTMIKDDMTATSGSNVKIDTDSLDKPDEGDNSTVEEDSLTWAPAGGKLTSEDEEKTIEYDVFLKDEDLNEFTAGEHEVSLNGEAKLQYQVGTDDPTSLDFNVPKDMISVATLDVVWQLNGVEMTDPAHKRQHEGVIVHNNAAFTINDGIPANGATVSYNGTDYTAAVTVKDNDTAITALPGTLEAHAYQIIINLTEEPDTFTVTYKPGDHGTFADDVHENLTSGTDTPATVADVNEDHEDGWVFDGWEPEVADKVTENAVYVAQWAEDTLVDPSVPNPPEGGGDGIADKYQITVYFTAVNGQFNPSTAEATTYYTTVVTKYDANGEPAEDGTAKLAAEHVKPVAPIDGAHLPGLWTQNGDPLPKVNPVGTIVKDEAWFVVTFASDTYTVTYTDGVENEVVFEDDSHVNLDFGVETPDFTGSTVRAGYVFAGWNPVVADYVTESKTYVAQWDVDTLVDPSVPNPPEGGGDGIADKYQITVYFTAVNGQFNPGTAEATTYYTTVVTKYDANGELSEDGTAKLAAEHVKPVAPIDGAHLPGLWTQNGDPLPKVNPVGTIVKDEAWFVVTFASDTYTVTYTDGVENEVVFEDDSHVNLDFGVETPDFTGSTVRAGYVFAGWNPVVADYVTESKTYVAQWDVDTLVDPSVPNPPEGGGDGIADKYQITVYFTAVNGQFNPGTAEATTYYTTVVTKYDANGELSEDGTAKLAAEHVKPVAPIDGAHLPGLWTQNGDPLPKVNPVGTIVKDEAWFVVTFASDTYTVTYTDGVDGKDVFEDQVYSGLSFGVETPAFVGTPKRSSYTFKGWKPVVADYVTESVTYVAQWTYTGGGSTSGGGGGSSVLNTEDHYSYIIGYKDGELKPYGTITRGEVATIFFRLLTDDAREDFWCTTNNYTDVPQELWCNNAISTLTNMGIIDGFNDGSFRPYAKITRAQFAKIAVGFFDAASTTYKGYFIDVPEGAWYTAYVEAAVREGLIHGFEDETFRPNVNITRAQACVIVNRAIDRKPHEEHLLPERKMITWPDNNPGDWFYADMQEATNSHDYNWVKEKVDGENVKVEEWTKKLPQRDWAAFENMWADAYSAPGGDVIED